MNEPSSTKLNRPYFKNLNALRFIAAFSVLIFHYFREVNGNFVDISASSNFQSILGLTDKGRLGVNFFFVLSGFLITYLILNEKKTTGQFKLMLFFQRRFLRIWPLYFIIGLLGFVIFPLLFKDFGTSNYAGNYFLFLANFNEIYNGGNGANFLTSPWSVAVEEQFYIFWGVLFFIIFRIGTKSLPYFILILYIISFYFRYEFWQDEKVIYYHTVSVFQDILMGACIAWSLIENKKWVNTIQGFPKIIIVFLYLLGIGVCFGKNILFKNELIIIERFVLSLFFGFIILDQIRGKHSFFKFRKLNILNRLGKISYGIYMYHLVVFYLLTHLFTKMEWFNSLNSIAYLILGIGGTILISTLSYRFIEKPLLKLKQH